MTTIFAFIRHGSTRLLGRALAGRTPDVHLDEQGQREAERLADRLSPLPFAALYASPRERAIETATPLAAARGLTIERCDGLDELDFGEWTGQTFEALAHDPRWIRFNTFRGIAEVPGGESMLHAQARVVSTMTALHHRHHGGVLALFSHADVIRGAVAHVLNAPLDLLHRFDVDPASVTLVSLCEAGPRLLRLNDSGRVAALPRGHA